MNQAASPAHAEPRVVPTGAERRTEIRREVSFAARLCYGPKYSRWADCTVKNLSDNGAKVELGSMYHLPRAFVLLHFSAGLAFEVVRRWRRADLIGVSFEARHDLSVSAPPRLAGVHETWLALRP